MRTWWMRVAVLALPLAAHGACTEQSLTAGWLWDYDGTMGNRAVRLTLQRDGDRLQGVYTDASELKDIRVEGRVAGGERIELNELGADGRIAARFEGAFVPSPDDDDDDSLRASSGCEIIRGAWNKPGASERLPFSVELQGGGAGTFGHRYAVTGAKDDEVIHRAALVFQQAVVAGDKAKVAGLVRYPVRVNGAVIRNSKELVAQYDALFTRAFVAAIQSAIPRNLFSRYDGIMLGRGEVWFGADGKVITLNP